MTWLRARVRGERDSGGVEGGDTGRHCHGGAGGVAHGGQIQRGQPPRGARLLLIRKSRN